MSLVSVIFQTAFLLIVNTGTLEKFDRTTQIPEMFLSEKISVEPFPSIISFLHLK